MSDAFERSSKINNMNSWSLENTNRRNNPLAKLMKEKTTENTKKKKKEKRFLTEECKYPRSLKVIIL